MSIAKSKVRKGLLTFIFRRDWKLILFIISSNLKRSEFFEFNDTKISEKPIELEVEKLFFSKK